MQTLTLLAAVGAVTLGWPLSTLGVPACLSSELTDEKKASGGCPEGIAGHIVGVIEDSQQAAVSSAGQNAVTAVPTVVRIGIAHGQIPYLGLPAMTTLFKIDAQLARQFDKGRRVLFHIIKRDGWLHVRDIVLHPHQPQSGQPCMSAA